jgi:hypothetical protein
MDKSIWPAFVELPDEQFIPTAEATDEQIKRYIEKLQAEAEPLLMLARRLSSFIALRQAEAQEREMNAADGERTDGTWR